MQAYQCGLVIPLECSTAANPTQSGGILSHHPEDPHKGMQTCDEDKCPVNNLGPVRTAPSTRGQNTLELPGGADNLQGNTCVVNMMRDLQRSKGPGKVQDLCPQTPARPLHPAASPLGGLLTAASSHFRRGQGHLSRDMGPDPWS